MTEDYKPIVADSNFAPLRVVVTRFGKPVDLAGCDAFVSVRDASKREIVIVSNEKATVVLNETGRAEFYFKPEHVTKIRRDGIWLVEWKFVDRASTRVFRLPPIRLPVTARLIS